MLVVVGPAMSRRDKYKMKTILFGAGARACQISFVAKLPKIREAHLHTTINNLTISDSFVMELCM